MKMLKMGLAKIFPNELVGEEIVVVDSTNNNYLKIQGKVVDETKMTLKVLQNGEVKTLLKSNITFKLVRTGQIVLGKTILKRSEERIKGR